MTADLTGVGEIAEAVRTGSTTAADVVEAHLARISEREADVHAFNLVLADEARQRRGRDRRRGWRPGRILGRWPGCRSR